MSTEQILLACDLDRTVLPNGKQPFDKKAITLFQNFLEKSNVVLAYISGRNFNLVQDAIQNYHIPTPDVIVGDVGTTMYFQEKDQFILNNNWIEQIIQDWNGFQNQDIHTLVTDLDFLTPQEPAKQNTCKRSYYTPINLNKTELVQKIQKRLKSKNIKAAVIFSIDEESEQGLLDILPASATKKHALKYLQQNFKIPFKNVIYAGDSGNDIEPITSGYQAILVKNARPEVKAEITKIAQKQKTLSQIYFAQGGYQKMQGNYLEGILEGLNHFGFIN